MIFFSECSDICDKCYTNYIGGCLAGHGDDDFIPITKSNINDIIKYASEKDILHFCKIFPIFAKEIKIRKILNNIKNEK